MKERSLRDLFHMVVEAIPNEQDLITIPPDMPVREAIKIMQINRFSQIPVVEGKTVLGTFSYRSFTNRILALPPKERDPLSLPVEEFIEDLKFASIYDELSVLLDEFELMDAMLVGSDDNLKGIVTTADALRYFYSVASPYVMLREIELAVRALMRESTSDEQLRACAEKCLKHYRERKQDLPTCLEEMTFNDYVMLLRYQDTWNLFQPAFGGSVTTVYAKLERLPELRNAVFHFRRELTAEEYEQLRTCREWLLKRIKKVEASKEAAKNA